MPSKTKPVIVGILVENPRRRRFSSSSSNHHNRHYHHHHHHHYHHLIVHGANPSRSGGGYNRRAALLDYSRRLRTSALPEASRLSQTITPIAHNNQHNDTQIVAVVKRKAKNATTTTTTTPACLGNWKMIIPSFLKPLMVSQNKEKKRNNKDNRFLATTKMKATVKSLQVQRRAAGFFRKFFASLRKQR